MASFCNLDRVLMCPCLLMCWEQTTLSTTRTVFCRHSSGALFPALLNVKPSPSGFVGIMQQLFTPDQYVPSPGTTSLLQYPYACMWLVYLNKVQAVPAPAHPHPVRAYRIQAPVCP